MAGVFQHHMPLPVKILLQMNLPGLERLLPKARNHCLCIRLLQMSVTSSDRIHQRQRPRGAQAHAAGTAHVAALAGSFRFLGQGILQLVAMLRQAARAHADIHFVIELLMLVLDSFGNLLEFLAIHGRPTLPTAPPPALPESGRPDRHPSDATGARPHAPTQRAVVSEIFPSGVVSPTLMCRCFSVCASTLSAPLM